MAIPPIPSTPFTPHAYSQDYWVDPVNGNDNNLGTSIETPFATITQAVTVVGSGSANIILATGTYNESTITLTQGSFNFTPMASNGLFGTTNLPTFNMQFVFNGAGVTTFSGCCFNGNLFLTSGDGVNLNNCNNGGINITTSSVVLCCNTCDMIGVEFTIGFDAFFLNQTWTDSIVINAGGVIIQSSTYCSPLTLNGGDLIVLETVITSQSSGAPAVIQTGGTLFLGDVQCYDIDEVLTGVTLSGGTYSFQNVDLNNSLSTISSTNIGNTTWFDSISTIAPLPSYQYTYDYWVDPVNGSDSNTGLSINSPFQTLTNALTVISNLTPSIAVNINLMAGQYNESDIDITLPGYNYVNITSNGIPAINPGKPYGPVTLNMAVHIPSAGQIVWTGIVFNGDVYAVNTFNQCYFLSTINGADSAGQSGTFYDCYMNGECNFVNAGTLFMSNCITGSSGIISFENMNDTHYIISNCDFSLGEIRGQGSQLLFVGCRIGSIGLYNSNIIMSSCPSVTISYTDVPYISDHFFASNCTFLATTPGGTALTISGDTCYLNNVTCLDSNNALTVVNITSTNYSFSSVKYLPTGSTITSTNLGYVSYFDAISTIAPLPSYQYTYDYWVDPVNGSDSNTGLSINTPFQTLTNALNVITAIVATTSGNFAIHCLAGQYNESTISNFMYGNGYMSIIGEVATNLLDNAYGTVYFNMAIDTREFIGNTWTGVVFNGDISPSGNNFNRCTFLSTINIAPYNGCTGAFTDCYFAGNINLTDDSPAVLNNCTCGAISINFATGSICQINNCDFSNATALILQTPCDFNNCLLNNIGTYSIAANFNSCPSLIIVNADNTSTININNSVLYATTPGGNALTISNLATCYLNDVTCLDNTGALTILDMPGTSYSFQGVKYLTTGSTLTGTNLGITSWFDAVSLVGGWTVQSSGTKLYFSNGGTNLMSLDTSGNIIALGTITPLSTP